ncbi:SMI1/KNR4 family protein [Streptomyces phyllanthi]|uniref:SMI1/KNR4 family protein n=1 Tax=Streptomyces phyllanthi TaxID=1803180 RepID=A0A5N8WH92_9ACTN|nr:SMI1/KNR4 family protein [Streptomyces phyllanthi]MPY46256.1 SMI1/KNR4 family protein [Streptomyces phyllanthi]
MDMEQLDQRELLSAVLDLTRPGSDDLRCDEAGHPAGHMCLVPSDENDLASLQEALSLRYGQPRNLAMDGYADPTVTPRSGLPLLTPFGERIVEMRAWAYGSRWIGCGTARFDDDARLVMLVAEREDPAADLPEGGSWVDGVVAVTGWYAPRTRTVDWTEVETRLGTALPSDYKRLVEVFGEGAFDGYLRLHVPDARFRGGNIVLRTERLGELTGAGRSSPWEPYNVYPAPGGLLQWADSEQENGFFWLTEGPDPDKWPILVTQDIPDSWVRFDETTAEFLHRMLTERQRPFSTARHFDVHWFQSYESESED